MSEEYISKKELLRKLNISYGQLYRWKREKLIPEDWFIKRASSTGQETYFPQKKIEERIHFILEMKDRYSLTDLCQIINEADFIPKISQRELVFSFTISNDIVSLMNKPFYSYNEAAILICCNQLLRENTVPLLSIKNLIANTPMLPQNNTGKDCIWHLFNFKKNCIGFFLDENSIFVYEKRMIPVAQFNITKIITMIKDQQLKKGER